MEEGAGGGHRDGGPDAGAEQGTEDEQLVERLRGVLEGDPRLPCVGGAVPVEEGGGDGRLRSAHVRSPFVRGVRVLRGVPLPTVARIGRGRAGESSPETPRAPS